MTDENRVELRRNLTEIVRACQAGGKLARGWRGGLMPMFFLYGSASDEDPPLTTAQVLALSVLLGEPVPLAVLLSACEDAGVFADGLAGEIAKKARAEERERCKRAADIVAGSVVSVYGRPGHAVSVDMHPTRPYFDCVIHVRLADNTESP